MAKIVDSVEINRSPEDVFKYLDQLERHGEWQDQIVSVKLETDGPTGVGTRATDLRKVPFGKPQNFTYEITEYDSPRRVAFRGTNGMIRPEGVLTVEPLEGGSRSRVTLDFELVGHGLFGKLITPMAMRDARKTVPQDQRRLKERLESGA